MPFVITETTVVSGRAVDATLCDTPDRRGAVQVKVKLISERALLIEPDDIRDVMSSTFENGRTEFAVSPSIRHARLAKASELLLQLTACLRPIAAESEDPELAELLQHVYDWVAREREREKGPPRSVSKQIGDARCH
jgi:hypothetical protein